MKITILYDNNVHNNYFKSKWGFSCLIEKENSPGILFDTGGQAKILMENMKKLKINEGNIDEIFISHPHWDHIGGLPYLYKVKNEVIVYVPASFDDNKDKTPPFFDRFCYNDNVISIRDAGEIHQEIYSSGELDGIEQALILKTEKGLVVVVGCSHPGVGKILDTASQFGKLYGIIGGLHGFSDYSRLEGLKLICSTHCTQKIEEIKIRYPDQFIEGGVGRIINI